MLHLVFERQTIGTFHLICLQVNRSLRAPLAPQLIFMPGGTTAAVATVAQTQAQPQQQQQHDAASTTTSAQSDSDQV